MGSKNWVVFKCRLPGVGNTVITYKILIILGGLLSAQRVKLHLYGMMQI